MPIIKSAKKALKQSIKRHRRNQHFKDLYKEVRKKFETAIKNKDLEAAKTAFYNKKENGKTVASGLQSMIDKLVKKNIIHKNKWNRRKAKFASMLKSLNS